MIVPINYDLGTMFSALHFDNNVSFARAVKKMAEPRKMIFHV